MAVAELEFTKNWENPEDFPTYEYNETQVRADIQLLFDELKNKVNELIGYVDSGDVPVTVSADDVTFEPTEGVPDVTDVQAAIEAVQAQIAQIVDEVAVPDGSITAAKLTSVGSEAGAAVTRNKIDNDAVNGDKIDDLSIDHNHIVDDAIRTRHILDHEVTNDKLDPNVLPNKADLFEDGIVTRNQLRLRRINRALSHGVSSYAVDASDVGAIVDLSAWDNDATVELVASSAIQTGSYVYLQIGDGISSISPVGTVSLKVAGRGAVSSYSFAENEAVLLIKTSTSQDSWLLIPLRAKIYTDDISNGAVTYEKTSGVQKTAQVIKDVKVSTADWSPLSSIDPNITPANFVNAPLRTDDLGELDISRVIARAYVGGNGQWDYNYEMIQECEVRLSQITSERFVFLAKTKPSRNVWFELLVF